MVNIPLCTRFSTSQVVRDFFHQQYFQGNLFADLGPLGEKVAVFPKEFPNHLTCIHGGVVFLSNDFLFSSPIFERNRRFFKITRDFFPSQEAVDSIQSVILKAKWLAPPLKKQRQ